MGYLTRFGAYMMLQKRLPPHAVVYSQWTMNSLVGFNLSESERVPGASSSYDDFYAK